MPVNHRILSGLRQRTESDCLNCGTTVHGCFCHQCGQENIEPRESFWSLLQHFFYDLLHFDGKFFSSVKYLLFRPGFLTSEYTRGKRASFLNPIRMYLFVSAIFFLLVFKVTSNDVIISKDDLQMNPPLFRSNSISAYDSLQQKLPPGERDGLLLQWINRRFYSTIEKYRGRESQLLSRLRDRFIHLIPTWMMISLPFFSLILYLLYFRNRRLYFSEHIIFSIHLYVAVYLQLMILIILSALNDILKWRVLSWVYVILTVAMFVHAYKAMRNFYGQSRFKTLLKYVLLGFSMMVIAIVLLFAMGLQSMIFV